MRGILPADVARRLVDESEFELDSMRELLARSRSLDRTGPPKPPPLPLMPLSPPASAPARAPAQAPEMPDTLAGRLAVIDAS